MRRINSDFQTLHISEEGQKLSNRDYFGYVEMDDFACYVLADSLDDEPAVNSARLVVDSIIRDFTEAPTMGKGTLRRYLLRAHTELLKQRAGMHLKVAVVVAVTDYRTLRYCHVGNSRLYLIRNARILEQTKDQSLTQNLLTHSSSSAYIHLRLRHFQTSGVHRSGAVSSASTKFSLLQTKLRNR